MSKKNHAIASDIFDALRDGLEDFVLSHYRKSYDDSTYLDKLADCVWDSDHLRKNLSSDDEAKLKIDPAGWLNSIWRNKHVFRNDMGTTYKGGDQDKRNGINMVGELLNARNRWAHKKKRDNFSDEDIYRLSDTGSRVLRSIGASYQAETISEIKVAFGEKIYIRHEAQDEAIVEALPAMPLDKPLILHKASPDRIDLRGARLRKMDLRNRNLGFAILSSAKLEESNLREEELSQVQLDHAALNGTDLSMARLVRADLSKANLESAKLPNAVLQRATLHHAKMRHVNLEFANMQYADLTKADMDSANLKNADLRYANLTDANLVGTNFSGANLQGANLQGAKLKWDGRDFLRKSPTSAVFDKTSTLPDGKTWTRSTNMTKFTAPPVDG